MSTDLSKKIDETLDRMRAARGSMRSEALKKVTQFEKDGKKAVVYRDAEWDEYRVKFYVVFKGVESYLNDADYHTDDKADATSTAKNYVNESKKTVSESDKIDPSEAVDHAENLL